MIGKKVKIHYGSQIRYGVIVREIIKGFTWQIDSQAMTIITGMPCLEILEDETEKVPERRKETVNKKSERNNKEWRLLGYIQKKANGIFGNSC